VGLAVLHAVAALVVGAQPVLADMTPRQKAAMVVVSPLPAPPTVGGVLVQRWNRDLPRPPGALVFVDQEGGATRAFRDLPPSRPAAAYTSEAVSTDNQPHVNAVLRPREIAGFRAAIAAGVPCVMVNNAFYGALGHRRASLAPAAYRLLRSTGFNGVAITDSLSIVAHPPPDWPVTAARAGADLLLFTNPKDARAAIEDLLPLARAGELDAHVARVLRFRARYALR
jgi:beta-glucosidase-like glycosyl hydrolase